MGSHVAVCRDMAAWETGRGMLILTLILCSVVTNTGRGRGLGASDALRQLSHDEHMDSLEERAIVISSLV